MINVDEFKETLRNNVVKFTFTKVDGTEREAIGTTRTRDLIYYNAMPSGKWKSNPGVITYFDLEKESWRSCRENSIISFEIRY